MEAKAPFPVDLLPPDLADTFVDDEIVVDKYGKERPRCKGKARKTGDRCRGWVWGQTDFCRFHGGPLVEGRAEAELIPTPSRPDTNFKEFFTVRFKKYMDVMKTHRRYEVDEQIASLRAAGDWYEEVLFAIGAPSVKDIENYYSIKEREVALIERMTNIESKRAFAITQQTMRELLLAFVGVVKKNIKRRDEQIALLQDARALFSADRLLMEPLPEEPIEAQFQMINNEADNILDYSAPARMPEIIEE